MDSISDRERILLGYAPRDALGGVESRSQRWNTDIDFVDVFGGPPRRASINKSRRIRRDSIDTSSRLSSGRGDLEASHRSRLGSDEKPVFGDVYDSSRRQQLGDDFYRDIFQISESVCASPKNGDPGPLMSSPTSRISSPNGPAPSRWDSPFGGSVLQTHPRLSETINKLSDYPAFDFPTKHSTFKSEEGENDAFSYPSSSNGSSTGLFTRQSIAGHVDLQNSGYNSYCQNPLSRKIPLVFEGFSEAMDPTFGIGEMLAGDNSNILEDYINNKQFHFSIYEWAGKGVMLVMPSDFDEKKGFKGLTRLPEVIVQELELHTDCNYFSRVTKPLKSGTVIQDTKAEKKADYHAEITANVSLTDSDLMFFEVATNNKSDKYGNQSEKASGSDFEENSSTCNTYEKQNSESKSPSRLFDSDMDKHKSKSSKWKQLRKESKLVPGEVNCNTLRDILSSSEDKARGNMVKGKVKEFIKKFTQESPQKRRSAFDVRKRSKDEDSRQDKVDELTHLSVTELDKLQEGVVNKSIPLFDIPCVRENQVIKTTEEEVSNIFYNDPTIDDSPSEEKIEVLHPQSGPASEDLINAACNEEIIPEDIEYMVHQLPVKQTEEAQNISQLNQIKKLEANILQWSKGKEGNIRSLLSTLQLVLWPECGWKQVPLVTIIEGPSVKKAYQKALLCLHPDKLQQKGASSDQKYIAEKVFNILQEAWDNFNSASQF